MSDDWQDAAFSTRHMHNRANRNSRSSKSTTAFDVRKTFGSYDVKCASYTKLDHISTDSGDAALHLYRLTENGLGVVGELLLPGVLHAAVLMTGSREGMRLTMEGLEPDDSGSRAAKRRENDDDDEDEDEEEDSNEQEEDSDENEQTNRFSTFEKNSFRAPRFWVKWNAIAPPPPKKSRRKMKRWTSELEQKEEEEAAAAAAAEAEANGEGEGEGSGDRGMVKGQGMGYFTFTGNTCRKFKGTISCEELGWKDVSIAGHKEVGRSESDVQVMWGNVEM